MSGQRQDKMIWRSTNQIILKQSWFKLKCGPVHLLLYMSSHRTCIPERMGAAMQTLSHAQPPPLCPGSTFSPLVTLSPPLLLLLPFSVWVCLGPAGEALSVNSGARTGPRGPDPWMPTLWERLFLFTPLSLLECLSSEVRNAHTHTFSLAHTHTHPHQHFLTFSACLTHTRIYTYIKLYTQTEWVMRWWKASVLCVNSLTLDSHPESLSPSSVPAKLSL